MSKYQDTRSIGKKGYLYVMSYPNRRDKHKIGYTLKEPNERAKSIKYRQKLSETPIVQYFVLIENPWEIEQSAHSIIFKDRINGYEIGEGKEWFNCSLERAIWAIRKAINIKKINNPKVLIVKEYFKYDLYRGLVDKYTREQEIEECKRKKELAKELEIYRKKQYEKANEKWNNYLLIFIVIILIFLFSR
ncbi:hypothetical protein QV06_09055 [Gallibacterium genomosp. 3]|uniref:Bacteriophage T5 Orf172 DNA-binding domain-containing protein n=1 Tax=Gallibacterium genomosp. 3 TaxID=505345 RepID=A0A1A7PQJ4_9PAST|nr:GIY-YIG nuclease family protein [Gallibacterium genomosp. 3]OBX04021.1 hypothetical protein QV06_09055 [Gallibacterium genomosp. 3]